MNVEEEQSREVSDGESEEEEGEDSGEEDLEESDDLDGYLDLEFDGESEEGSGILEKERRYVFGKRLISDGQKVREVVRTELFYTFVGRQISGFFYVLRLVL